MAHVLSFSGGKDSTALLIYLIEKKMPLDKVIFVNTTKEHPELERHARRILNSIPYETHETKIQFDYHFTDYIVQTGKNKGEKGYGWPTMRTRWCTRLKVAAIKEAVSHNDIQYVGISADESHRAKSMPNRLYPLVDAGITGSDALRMCYDAGYDWEGLYEEYPRSSCWCCPLQRVGSLRHTFHTRPHLWDKMLQMDDLSQVYFHWDNRLRKGKTLRDFDLRFKRENRQLSLPFKFEKNSKRRVI